MILRKPFLRRDPHLNLWFLAVIGIIVAKICDLPTAAALSALSFTGAIHARKSRKITARLSTAFLFVFGVLLLPAIFSIPSAIESYNFGYHLAVGMNRGQVEDLRRKTFGSSIGTLNSTLNDAQINNDKDVEHVWYTSGGTFCLAWGKLYQLTFDSQGLLRDWKHGTWLDGC